MTFEARQARRSAGDKKFYCCVGDCCKTALYAVGREGYCGNHKAKATQKRVRSMATVERFSRGGYVRNTKRTFMRRCIDETLYRPGKQKPTAKPEQAVATQ